MDAFLVVTATFPISDLPSAARALVARCGGSLGDTSVQLRRCRGIVAENLQRETAEAMAAALRESGCQAWALPSAALPVLPRPVTAHLLDPRDPTVLKAQVHFSGPPELIEWQRIAAVLPARWHTTQRTEERPQPRKSNFGALALDVATTGGLGTLWKQRSAAKAEAVRTESIETDAMIELVALAPLRRVHAFAGRMDYGPLQERGVHGGSNWRRLLEALHDRTRPETVGRAQLEQFLRGEELPAHLQVSDQNDLARTMRWLLILATLEKLARRNA